MAAVNTGLTEPEAKLGCDLVRWMLVVFFGAFFGRFSRVYTRYILLFFCMCGMQDDIVKASYAQRRQKSKSQQKSRQGVSELKSA